MAFGSSRVGLGCPRQGDGVRVIYFNRFASGEIWLLLVYGKSTGIALQVAAV